MKKIFAVVLCGLAFLATTAYTVQAIINWKINNDTSQVKFVMQGHGQELIGAFRGVKGNILFDANDLANSSFKCDIEVATINTGNNKRDGHLQAASWFDAVAFPTINFTSSKIIAIADGYEATGMLTAKNISKEISIPFTFTGKETAGTFKGSFKIKRTDFGIGKADAEVGDDVTIQLEIPVTK
ncbi:YceI family protein [soil metagenome]